MPRKNGAIRREEHRRNRPYIEGGGGNKKPKPFRSDMTPNEKQLWFEQALKYDFIDKKYGTFDQLNTVLNWLRGSGLGDAEIRRLLGFQTDNPVIKKGQIYGRGIRESVSPAARADMEAVLGEGSTSNLEKYLRSKWAKARKLLTLEDVRSGKWSDLGHFIEGSLRDPDLAAGENAVLNRSRGSSGDEPERFPVPVVEQIAPVTPDEQAWNAAAEQNGGIEKRSGLQGAFPQDVAELADFDFVEPEQLPILAQKLESLDPTQRRAVIENIKATGEVKLDINPDRYKTGDLTAENGSGDTTLTVDDASTLQQNGNGGDVEHAGFPKKQWQEYSTQYQKPPPPKGWDFKNFSVRWTDNKLVIIDRSGRRMYNRFDGVVDRYDIFESFLNDKVAHDAASGKYLQALGSAGQALAGNLLSVLDPNAAPTTVAAGQLAKADKRLGILMGAYSLAQGGVRFAQGWSAAKDGVSWEEYQEQQIQNWLDEQERKEQERQLAASRAAVKNIKRQSKPTQLELDLTPNRGQLAATGF